MAVARRQTHHWLDPSSRVGSIRTERTWQASAANVIAASRVLTGAVPRDQSSGPDAQRPNPLNVAKGMARRKWAVRQKRSRRRVGQRRRAVTNGAVVH
jgi:hypothetical protein